MLKCALHYKPIYNKQNNKNIYYIYFHHKNLKYNIDM